MAILSNTPTLSYIYIKDLIITYNNTPYNILNMYTHKGYIFWDSEDPYKRIASNKMLKKNVIVKELNAVESLGSCTVIASDKTGTLTVNEQTAKKIVLPNGSIYNISGSGYNDKGSIKPVDDANINDIDLLIKSGYINNEAKLEKKGNAFEYFVLMSHQKITLCFPTKL